MAKKERVKKNKYSYEKTLKKVVKNPQKRCNAGVVVIVNGKDMEYPPRLVDIQDETVEVKGIKIHKSFFENAEISISGFPAVYLKGNDIMTSAGIYYNELVPGKHPMAAPKQVFMDGYYIEEESGKKKFITGKRPVLNTFQPSETVPGSILEGMVYSISKVGDIKEWLKKNKTILYVAFGTLALAGLGAYFGYQLYSEIMPKVLSACKAAASGVAKAAEVVALN